MLKTIKKVASEKVFKRMEIMQQKEVFNRNQEEDKEKEKSYFEKS